MNLDVSIRFSDPKVASEIADAKIADCCPNCGSKLIDEKCPRCG